MSTHAQVSERLFTRAFGALFLEARPQLARIASRALNHAAAGTAAEHEDVELYDLELEERPFERMFPEPSFAPDMTLVEPGTCRIRAVFEVKLEGAWNATSYATCEDKHPVPGEVAAGIRHHYRSHPDAMTSARDTRGVFQTDAYLAWNWWEHVRYNDQLASVSPEVVHVSLTLDGAPLQKVSQRGAAPFAPAPWTPVSIHRFAKSLAVLAEAARDLSADDHATIASFVFLCYTTAETDEVTAWDWVRSL